MYKVYFEGRRGQGYTYVEAGSKEDAIAMVNKRLKKEKVIILTVEEER